MTVELFKREVKYNEKKDGKETGKEKTATNFFVRCGDNLIPVEVKYFSNPKCDNRDPNYAGRIAVMSAFAAELPPRENE